MTSNPQETSSDVAAIRELYPTLTDEQLRQAEETLDRYLESAARQFNRIRADPTAYKEFRALTAEMRGSRMTPKGQIQSDDPRSD